jgi:uncharacterized protein YkwD
MKKLVWLPVVLLICVLLAACGSDSKEAQIYIDAISTKAAQATIAPTATSDNDGTFTVSPHPTATPTQVPATPTPVPTKKPTPTPLPSTGASTLEQQLFNLINQDRAASGLPAYTWEPRLQKSGYLHNLTMAGGCGLSHQCSGEPAIGARVTNQGVQWSYVGENIGTGTVQASQSSQWNVVLSLHRNMMAEVTPNDGHRKNLLSSNFKRIGISIYVDSNSRLWMTEDFAN